MRRGQLQHVFAFIMMVLIAGAVLLLGYRFLAAIIPSACQADQLSFINSLRDDLSAYSSYGSVHHSAWSVPCKAAAVCFVDASVYGVPSSSGVYPGNSSFNDPGHPKIEDEVHLPSTPPANVFLVDQKGVAAPLPFFADKVALKAPSRTLCINATGGAFHAELDGGGRTVLIKDAS